ncbi:MAG: hypothetical protein QMD04_06555 [Anaerolineales bacterium]|nr:hypothetical protein [Anaerolineales bacterium]
MDTEKKLKLMRFWLFGIFVIVFAAMTAFLFILTAGNIWHAIQAGWSIWFLTAVLCVAVYFGYKWYLGRKK